MPNRNAVVPVLDAAPNPRFRFRHALGAGKVWAVVVHTHHDLVAREVRSWYTEWPGRAPGPAGSDAGVEVRVRETSFGFLRDGRAAGGRRVVLMLDDPSGVADALASCEEFFGTPSFDVWVDDRQRAATLDPVLVSHGFHPEDNTIVLALTGPLDASEGPAELDVIEVIDDEHLRTWASVKVVAFSNSEDEPPSDAIAKEMEARRAEWPIARYDLANLRREPVAILAHYMASEDQMVFNLATRVPYRHLGIAQALLRGWAERATDAGARSLLINCDEHGQPAALYRRIGFTDEVYWHRRYQPTGRAERRA